MGDSPQKTTIQFSVKFDLISPSLLCTTWCHSL